MKPSNYAVLTSYLYVFAMLFIFAWAVQFLVNRWFVYFNWPEIDFWQAVGLCVLLFIAHKFIHPLKIH